MKIIVLGATGLIGSAMFRVLNSVKSLQVFGTIRDNEQRLKFAPQFREGLISNIELLNLDILTRLFAECRPDVVINCAGVTKHLPSGCDPLIALPINALMPHRVAAFCEMVGARFINISTDCVFLGSRGNYREVDQPDACDVYGRSKILGEVIVGEALTIRASTIGHELSTHYGLLDWFLAQKNRCPGYRNAIFSGLPTVFLAQVVRDFVLPDNSLSGLMHVAAKPISKYDLLKMIANKYEKSIEIYPDDNVTVDRSLDGSVFSSATGFVAPEWPELIQIMFDNS